MLYLTVLRMINFVGFCRPIDNILSYKLYSETIIRTIKELKESTLIRRMS